MRTKLTMFLAGALLVAASATLAQTPVPVGSEFLVNTYTTDRQLFAEIAVTPDGDFVVVWESNGSGDDMSYWSVQGQRFAADASPIGSQFQVNTYATSIQGSPAIALTSDSDFVVVWESRGSPGDDTGDSIQGQRLAADASPIGSQFQVNTYTTGIQLLPAVAVAPDGDFVVVWHSYGSPGDDSSYASVQGQRFARDASPIGSQFQINSYSTGFQSRSALAVDPAGDFVVVWTSDCCGDDDFSYWSIRGQRFARDASPLGAELQITAVTTDIQALPTVAMDSAGDFVVVWMSDGSSGGDISHTSIQGQRFAADASALGSQFQVNTYTTSTQSYPVIAGRPAGDFVVLWQSNGSANDDSVFSIQGQRFAADASPLGIEFQVNTYTTNDQRMPAVALDPAGDFVVVWRSLGSDNGDTSSWSVQGQRFQVPIFVDGFESGDTTAWSSTVP